MVLCHQEDGAKLPRYRQNAVISGYIELANANRVLDVSILVEGRVDLAMARGTKTQSVQTINSTTTLWKHKSTEHPATCPQIVPFAYALPAKYEDATGKHLLPPTFQLPHDEMADVFARSAYRLRVAVTRKPKIGPWPSTKYIFIPFEYRPQYSLQGWQSTSSDGSCAGSLCAIKSLPEEWYQSTTSIEVPSFPGQATGNKAEPSLDPVHLNLLIPEPRTFALSASIPFHLQLSGRVDSLRALIPAPSSVNGSRPSTSSYAPTSCFDLNSPSLQPPAPVLRVFLLRQVRVEIRGAVRAQNIVLGEAQLEPVPPCHMPPDMYRPPQRCGQEYVGWTGRLKVGEAADVCAGPADDTGKGSMCSATADVGGFRAGDALSVNDFVAVSVGVGESPFWKDVKASISVRFV